MSQFSRRARWLRQLFTQSVSPAVQDPSSLSDDVSLVQPYDGSGWGIVEPTFPNQASAIGVPEEIRNPEVSIRDFLTTIGITTVTDMFNISDDLVARILSIKILNVAGGSGTQLWLQDSPHTGSGITNHQGILTQRIDPSTLPSNDHTALEIVNPILLPGHQVNCFFSGGNSTSQFRITFVMVIAPVGTVFYR